jgi:hypothetical protein
MGEGVTNEQICNRRTVVGEVFDHDTMTFAGHESGALLLGVFQVSILHNIVHILFGVAGLAMSRMASAARAFLIGGGLIYAALWLYGLVIDHESTANFVPVNTAVNWLHLALAVVMLALGLAAPTGADVVERTTPRDLGR